MATKTSATPEPRKWQIQSGPSKYDFFESLGFRKQPNQLVMLKLKGEDGGTGHPRIHIRLISKWITPDDTYPDHAGKIEGHEWKFIGVLYNYDSHIPDPQFRDVWLIGHFSTKTREGEATELPVSSPLFRQLFELFF